MKLCEVLKGCFPLRSMAPPKSRIDRIIYDSREAGEGCLFVASRGVTCDGHMFVESALRAGALCLIERPDLMRPGCVLVRDTLRAGAAASANLFGNPAGSLRLIGVTGTAGKTSVCYLIRDILAAAGHSCGIVGTIENSLDSDGGSTLTTPLPPSLHAMLAAMRDGKAEYAVIEASSQALDQQRLAGLTFETAVFTNLGRDHLDYHGSTENYFAAKQKLFCCCRCAAVNGDDEYAVRAGRAAPRCAVFSLRTGDVTAKNIRLVEGETEYTLCIGNFAETVHAGAGIYNVYNSLAAACAAFTLGIEPKIIAAALDRPRGVMGRMEKVALNSPFSVYIDFAHTPEELAAALSAARQISRGRVIALFGCGGDRDRAKRPVMARISAANADFSVFTSCNPRTEDPRSILKEMTAGLFGRNFVSIADRRRAIEFALRAAHAGDLILLAGKGHELYQIIGDRKLPFDERAETIRIYTSAALKYYTG